MRGLVPIAIAGCSFAPVAETRDHQVIIDDTAADFAAGTLDELAIDPLGKLAPEAYARGGLHCRSYARAVVGPTTKWQDLTAAALGPMLGERYGEVPVAAWAGHPLRL